MENFIVEINDQNFTTILKAHRLVMVDFWATWCQPCLQFSEVIAQLAKRYEKRVAVCKIDIDHNPQVVTKNQIKTIPTSILFYKEVEVDRIVGNVEIEILEQSIEKYLVESV